MPRDEDTQALWRAGVLVYRRAMARHRDKEWLCHAAAVGAVMQMRPDMGWEEASKIVIEAIAAISARWPEWMWKGVGEEPDWG